MESCEDATVSSELEGQWAERERRWKTDAGEMNKAEDGPECREREWRRDPEKAGMNKERGRQPLHFSLAAFMDERSDRAAPIDCLCGGLCWGSSTTCCVCDFNSISGRITAPLWTFESLTRSTPSW